MTILSLLRCIAPVAMVPFVGVRDALPAHALPVHALPAHAHGAFVATALGRAGTAWTHGETRHAHLHTLVGSGAVSLAALRPIVDSARAASLAWLGIAERDAGAVPVLEVLVVGSREAMRPFTGGTPGGHAVPEDGAAMLVAEAGGAPPALVHELTHVLSWRLWGTPGGRWLSEGVATAAVGSCHGYPLHALAAGLARDGRAVPLAELRREFVVAGDMGLAHYVEAGSLVSYVRERWGRDRLRRLWATGLRGVHDALGVDQDALEAGWRARVATADPAPAAVFTAIRQTGCETR